MLLQTTLNETTLLSRTKCTDPRKSVSMASPISNIISEIFLQNLEQFYLKQLLDTNNIIFYIRYVDDILIIYDTEITPETINEQINNIHPNLYFTPTQEQNNTINFLDLLLIRQPTTIDIDIFRKPTTTDTTINFTSNHPTEHKMAAYCHLINRMLTLPLSTKRKKIEWQKILTVANNNKFPSQLITKLKAQMQQKNTNNYN